MKPKNVKYNDVEAAFAHIISVVLINISYSKSVSTEHMEEYVTKAIRSLDAIKTLEECAGIDSDGDIKRNRDIANRVITLYTGGLFETK